MKFSSTDFEDRGDLAEKFSCAGEGIRPALAWSEIPPETKSLAITLTDPDAPSGNFVHWVAINIPSSKIAIGSDEAIGEELPNSSGKTVYVPPCPPTGKHRYIFTLYALDTDRLGVSSYESFIEAAKPHIIDQTTLTGLYGT